MNITFNFSKIQGEIFKDTARYKVVIAGRRVGKTYVVVRDMILKALTTPNITIWYLALTYDQAKRLIWQDLKSILPPELITYTNNVSFIIQLYNGSTIQLFGINKANNLRGVGIHHAILDEFAFMPKSVWEVIQPMLATTKGSCTFISTPNPSGNLWDRQIFNFAKKDDTGEWSAHHYTTLDGGLVPATEIESAKRILSEKQFRIEYEASFDFVEGVIYHAFSQDNVCDYEDDEISVLHIGMDFNVDPMTAVVGIKQKDKLYIVDEITIKDSNTTEICQEIKNRYPNRAIIVYPDPSGKARKTSALYNTDFSIINTFGYKIIADNKAQAVEDRFNEVNALLCNARGDRRLFISKKCEKLIDSLKFFTYKDGTRVPDKSKGVEHWADALGYMIHQLFPIQNIPNVNNINFKLGN